MAIASVSTRSIVGLDYRALNRRCCRGRKKFINIWSQAAKIGSLPTRCSRVCSTFQTENAEPTPRLCVALCFAAFLPLRAGARRCTWWGAQTPRRPARFLSQGRFAQTSQTAPLSGSLALEGTNTHTHTETHRKLWVEMRHSARAICLPASPTVRPWCSLLSLTGYQFKPNITNKPRPNPLSFRYLYMLIFKHHNNKTDKVKWRPWKTR